MKSFIDTILQFKKPGKKLKEECVFINDHFIVVKDIKMINKNKNYIHYTAWFRYNRLSSLEDIDKNDIDLLKNIDFLVRKYINQIHNNECIKSFIHYPPSYYRLHIHFCNEKAMKDCEDNIREYYISDIINAY